MSGVHYHIIIMLNWINSKSCPIMSISSCVIRSFKSEITKQIHQSGYRNRVWQRNFYERIIRDENEYDHIRYYIKTNPQNWVNDENNV